MVESVKIICENTDTELIVSMGTSLLEVENILSIRNPQPFLAAYVNNCLKELSYKIYEPVSVRFIDITHFEGIRVYQRTLFFTMTKAVHDLYPGQRFRVKHAVSKGFYCEVDGIDEFTEEQIEKLRMRMEELINQNIPIVRERVRGAEAEEIYTRMGFTDKLALLHSRPKLYVTIYHLANIVGNMYGAMAPSTGYLHLFDLRKFYKGIFLAIPKRNRPRKTRIDGSSVENVRSIRGV